MVLLTRAGGGVRRSTRCWGPPLPDPTPVAVGGLLVVAGIVAGALLGGPAGALAGAVFA